MERRKAFAIAAAISMSAMSGAYAVGANLGAFGAGSPVASASASAPALRDPVQTSVTKQKAKIPATRGEREEEDRGGHDD